MLKLVLLLCFVAACYGCRRTVSCPGIGSFGKTGPYKRWPLPKCPGALDFTMRLYTRRNMNNGMNISPGNVPSVLYRRVRTIFLIHGYNKADEWFGEAKQALLNKGCYNVITVNWNSKGMLRHAASNTRTVGAAVAQLAKYLVETDRRIVRGNLWCIGRSLGAHTCGVAGKVYRFARITGLDPAGPKYNGNEGAGLQPQDADFVDVIHTGAAFLGIMTPLGHVDFYPNGGKKQPECNMFGIIRRRKCDHKRSTELFIDSVKYNSGCVTDVKCLLVMHGRLLYCLPSRNHRQQMGFQAEYRKARGIFYLRTSGSSPFCYENGRMNPPPHMPLLPHMG